MERGVSRGVSSGAGAGIVIVVILIIGAAFYLSSRPATSSSITSQAKGAFSSFSSAASSAAANAGGSSKTVKVSIPAGSGTNQSSPGYSPDMITVVIGVNNTVTWTNNDGTSHTVTATNGAFDSKVLSPGQSFSYTFTTPGDYNYHCTIHSWMTGAVVVESK